MRLPVHRVSPCELSPVTEPSGLSNLSEHIGTYHPQLTVYGVKTSALRHIDSVKAHNLEGERVINGLLAVEKDRPMHAGEEWSSVIDAINGSTIPLSKLKSKLEHSFTDPSYRKISTRSARIRDTSATYFPFTEFAFSSAVGWAIIE
jgi:hypothetical protein